MSSIVNFGAFVDLGGVDGLVHVSELSWKHIDHPSEVVEVGQEVEVEVLDVDLDRERVSLSLKATQEDPWRQFARTHAIQQIVPGKVTKLVPFGAFVRVDDGIEGLVHISELAERHVEIPEQVVQVGSDVMVKVIDIDLERRRISLSLKQANEGFVEGEEHFDPTLYGMAATYDTEGNYIYPEGFDPETGEWLEGYDKQREAWEHAVRGGPRSAGRRTPSRCRPRVRPTPRRPRPRHPPAPVCRRRWWRGDLVVHVLAGADPRGRGAFAAPWPPTRRSPLCGRSSPAASSPLTTRPRPDVRVRAGFRISGSFPAWCCACWCGTRDGTRRQNRPSRAAIRTASTARSPRESARRWATERRSPSPPSTTPARG